MIDLFPIGELGLEIIFNAAFSGLRNGDAVSMAGGMDGGHFSKSSLA